MLLLQTLESVALPTGGTFTGPFLALWFTHIDDFTGLHSRKLGILAICKLLEVPFAALPASAQQGRVRSQCVKASSACGFTLGILAV